MSLTLATLRAAGATDAAARAFIAPLAQACKRLGIVTPRQVAAFVAQTAHESAGFTRLEENLNYSTADRLCRVFPSKFPTPASAVPYLRNPAKLANRVYSNRLGNADEASGDGARYIGRGLIQLTGRANYMAAGDAIGIDYKARPELVAMPEHAALTAAWFWASAGCNALAEAGKFDATTRTINGPAMLGAADRRARYEAALQAMCP